MCVCPDGKYENHLTGTCFGKGLLDIYMLIPIFNIFLFKKKTPAIPPAKLAKEGK
jgi:hypothetical protein